MAHLRFLPAVLFCLLTFSAAAHAQDTDGDGLSDADELAAGSNQLLVDTDADGLGDGAEVLRWGTDPTKADSDGGGEWDLAELFGSLTDPTDPNDDATPNGGGGAFHYWLDRAENVDDEVEAELALAETSYEAIRAFRWPNFTDFERDEEGDFGIDVPFVGLFGGDRDEYAGVVHGWLYVPQVATNNNRWSIAVGSADGWVFEGWYGTQTLLFEHDGGGFRAEHEVYNFPTTGGLFPFEVVTWEHGGGEAFELSWAQGNVDYDEDNYELIPPTSIYASDLRIQQSVIDVNGGVVMPGDTLELLVEMSNEGQVALYAVELQPRSSNTAFQAYAGLPPGAIATGPTVVFPIVDAQTVVTFRYTVTVVAAGAVRLQAEAWGDAFPRNYGIGARRVRVLSDDPVFDIPTDDGNAPFNYFAGGLLDDDQSQFSTGETIDVDQCALGLDDCDTNASCAKIPGSWTCTCDTGFSGDGQTCMDIDECSGLNDCDVNAMCQNLPGTYLCTCASGFVGDGLTCADVDECATNPCDSVATCTNTPGDFSCTCPSGYLGDGLTCVDVDECLSSPCDLVATCTNEPGSFTCACPAGYDGDGTVCADVDECAMTPCDPLATCVNEAGGFSCSCPVGYSGDGLTCLDIDECESNPCDPLATCTNEPGTYSCGCPDGYSGDGTSCTDIDECASSPCDPVASCTNEPGAYSCTCPDGYSGDGTACTEIDECAIGGDDCDPNATCTNEPGGFSCACDEGFEGTGQACVAVDCACGSDEVCFVDSCFPRCDETADCSSPQARCYDDRCAEDACDGVTCATGEVCAGGSCFLVCGSDVDCSNPDDRCFDNRCTSGPCDDVTCAVGQVCYGGGCFDVCGEDADCDDPADRCYESRCASDPCDDVACADTQLCWGGGCFDRCSTDVDCSSEDQSCFDDRCAVDPCDQVQCATGEQCAAGFCRRLCDETTQCAAGEVCDRGLCALAPNTPEDGCGCGSATGRGVTPGFLLVVALWWSRRRRRSS